MATRKTPKKKASFKPEEVCTATQAGRILGVSARRIRQLAEEGRLTIAETSPLKVLVSEIVELRKEREEEEAIKAKLPSPPSTSSSSIRLSPSEYAEALEKAREAGKSEAYLLLEAKESEVRSRAERAEQRAIEAEAKLLEVTSTAATLQGRLEALESRKGLRRFFR